MSGLFDRSFSFRGNPAHGHRFNHRDRSRGLALVIAEALLATGDTHLIENNNYDYFWGCGRDRRGENMYGKVLMNVREKLREEQSAAS